MFKKRAACILFALLVALAPLGAYTAIRFYELSTMSDADLLDLNSALQAELALRGLSAGASSRSVPSATLVWVPRSGSKYHKKSTCSNMKNPIQVTIDAAIECGFTPCSKCNPPRR